MRQHFAFCASLISTIPDLIIYLPIYPLAPDAKSKEMQAGLLHVYDRVVALHPGAEISAAGDSAGGCLALTLVYDALARDGKASDGDSKMKITKLLLLSPALDLRVSDEERQIAPSVSRPSHLRSRTLRQKLNHRPMYRTPGSRST